VIDIIVLTTNNWCFTASQACCVFTICLKVGCSLIYLPVQLKKPSFVFSAVILSIFNTLWLAPGL